MTLQCVTMLFYVIFLPGSLLINSSEVKEQIAESSLYLNLITMLGWKPTIYRTPEEEDDPTTIRRRSDADPSPRQDNLWSEGQSTSCMTVQTDNENEENMFGRSNVRLIENEKNSLRSVEMKDGIITYNTLNDCQNERLNIVDLEVSHQWKLLI